MPDLKQCLFFLKINVFRPPKREMQATRSATIRFLLTPCLFTHVYINISWVAPRSCWNCSLRWNIPELQKPTPYLHNLTNDLIFQVIPPICYSTWRMSTQMNTDSAMRPHLATVLTSMSWRAAVLQYGYSVDMKRMIKGSPKMITCLCAWYARKHSEVGLLWSHLFVCLFVCLFFFEQCSF